MTDISSMTNEQLAEALAIEAMGLGLDLIENEWGLRYYRGAGGKSVMDARLWQPCTDLNQAVECAEKWANETNAKIFLEYSNLSWQAATIETGAIRVNSICEHLARALCEAVLSAARGEG